MWPDASSYKLNISSESCLSDLKRDLKDAKEGGIAKYLKYVMDILVNILEGKKVWENTQFSWKKIIFFGQEFGHSKINGTPDILTFCKSEQEIRWIDLVSKTYNKILGAFMATQSLSAQFHSAHNWTLSLFLSKYLIPLLALLLSPA